MDNDSKKKGLSSYLCLVPRGFHYVVQQMIEEQLHQAAAGTAAPPTTTTTTTTKSGCRWDVRVKVVAEQAARTKDYRNFVETLKRKVEEREAAKRNRRRKKRRRGGGGGGGGGQQEASDDDKGDGVGIDRDDEMTQTPLPSASSSRLLPVGTVATKTTVQDRDRRRAAADRYVSLGYDCRRRRRRPRFTGDGGGDEGATAASASASAEPQQQPEGKEIWTEPGQLQGLVWLQIDTNAPVEIVAKRLRCLGPLLATVKVWDGGEEEEDSSNCDRSTRSPAAAVNLGETQSREGARNEIRRLIAARRKHLGGAGDGGGDDDKEERNEYARSFENALRLWLECVKRSWNLPQPQVEDLAKKVASGIEGGPSPPPPPPLRYRLSCIRNESKKYEYSRQELLADVAGIVVPPDDDGTSGDGKTESASSPSARKDWTVDLGNYDLEIVLLVRPHALAIGLALRPYRHLGAKSFSTGVPPPDVSPPYLTGQVLSGLTKLRPSTAQILLHMAHLQPGDVVLDPCAGVGTIPLETSLTGGGPPVVSIGGDLALTPQGLGPVTTSYVQQTRSVIQRSHQEEDSPGRPPPGIVPDFLSWDACNLPIRSGSVDAVVSDLPFGQQCSSSAHMDRILPLLIGEVGRVLRQKTGRAVLLCGSYVPILEALENANRRSTNDDVDVKSAERDGCRQGDGSLMCWELPCEAVFPVNIGGLLAWVIYVRRADGPAVRLKSHDAQVRKLARKRDLIGKLRKNDHHAAKTKRLQS